MSLFSSLLFNIIRNQRTAAADQCSKWWQLDCRTPSFGEMQKKCRKRPKNLRLCFPARRAGAKLFSDSMLSVLFWEDFCIFILVLHTTIPTTRCTRYTVVAKRLVAGWTRKADGCWPTPVSGSRRDCEKVSKWPRAGMLFPRFTNARFRYDWLNPISHQCGSCGMGTHAGNEGNVRGRQHQHPACPTPARGDRWDKQRAREGCENPSTETYVRLSLSSGHSSGRVPDELYNYTRHHMQIIRSLSIFHVTPVVEGVRCGCRIELAIAGNQLSAYLPNRAGVFCILPAPEGQCARQVRFAFCATFAPHSTAGIAPVSLQIFFFNFFGFNPQ